MKTNARWHSTHRIPKPATMAERVRWHVAHAKHCGCRPMPRSIRAHIADRFVPDGWPVVTPRIVADDVAGLVRFIKAVFGATGRYREDVPSELQIGDSKIMVSGTGERRAMGAFLYVYVKNADGTFRRAVKAGARIIEEPALMPYGDRRAMVEDKWGNTWQIATRTR